MPMINMSGQLAGQVLICLQEPSGKLGPRVKKSLYQADNMHVTCSKSGKLTKIHMKYWAKEVLYPSVSEDVLLLMDSWSGQTNSNIFDEVFVGDIKCRRMQIPLKTTGDIQPLDRYFFRQWKYMKQKICDRITLDCINIDITSRNNIL